MATAGSIVIDLLMRTGSFTTDMARAEKRVQDFGKKAGQAATVIASMAAAFGTAAFGIFIRETVAAEREQAQLAAVLRSTGEAAGFSRDQLNDMASAMSNASILSAGDINQAQTSLLAFTGIAGTEFTQALQAAIDMSARTGMSVVSAAETIGRALDIPSQGLTALSRQGFRFTDDQKKLAEQLEATGRTAEAQGIILSALEESYGGAAQAARDTFGGSLVGLQNTLNDLMTGSDGSLDGATRSVNELTRTLQGEETRAAFSAFVEMIAGATTAFAQFMETIAKGEFWGWAITSGSDAANAALEMDTLNRSLEKLKGTRQAFLDSAVPTWFVADDLAILDAQIKSTEQKIAYLRSVESRNAIVVNTPNIPIIDLTDTGLGRPPPLTKKSGKLDDGQQYIKQMIERIGLIGKETEAEKLLARISVDSIKFRTEAQKEDALAKAQVLDDLSRQSQLAEGYKALMADLYPDRSKADQFISQIAMLSHAMEKGWIDADRYSEAVGLLEKKFSDTSETMGQFAIQAARNIESSLGDGLFNILKGNFDDIGQSFSDMLLRMAAEAAAANVAGALFGNYDKTGQIGGLFGQVGNWLSGLGGTGASTIGAGSAVGGAGAVAFPVSPFFSGGYTGPGGKYEPAGVVHKGEGVLSQEEIRAIGGERGFNALRQAIRGPRHSMGGMAGSPALPNLPGSSATATAAPVVNLTNNGTPQQVQSASASFDGERWILNVVMKDIRRNGPLGQMMRGAGVV